MVAAKQNRALIMIQLPVTLGVLACVQGNLIVLAMLLVLWRLTFGALREPEINLFLVVCAFFTAMNAMSLKQGIFAFTHPDVLGMPYYELVMWGFYVLHTKRMLGGPAPAHSKAAWVLAILYSAAFGTLKDPQVLLLVTGGLLALGLALFHERGDLAYVGYMIVLGALVEYTGVWSGEWHYPGNPPGGVPPWFVTLWGGVGLFLRRLVLPILATYDESLRPAHAPS
jgi:hypothetical protein